VPTQPLPEGWNGKQWGCERMGRAARTEWILFTDADVRLAPDCLGRAVAEAKRLNAALLSTIPREETGSPLERLVVPLIHWMLFSWLPMPRMRTTNDPATSAGCGQFLLVRRDAWEAAGGHAAFRDSMHDGIKLPRNVRRAGFHTDLYDGGESVSCRMYRNAGETWRGFTKNAYEGLGSPVVLAVFTLLEAAGILLPWIWLPIAIARGETPLGPTVLASFAVAAQLFQRTILARRFAQPWECVALHPVTIALLLAIQWRSWWLHLTKRRAWRGRTA
jgi:cellulose synthase/poly-beta-1,6-N-acetylglucosamine synthase-like glycosyltransferase